MTKNKQNKQKVIIVIIREVSSGLVFLLLSINLLGQLFLEPKQKTKKKIIETND